MRKTLALFSCLLVPFLAQAGIIYDFESGNVKAYAHKGEERGGASSIENIPGQQNKAWKISWGKTHSKWIDIVLNPPSEIPELAQKMSGVVTMRVYSDGTGNEAKGISLRLTDSKNETFQWPKKVDFSQKGYQELSYEISGTNFQTSWGDKKTGQMLPPVKLSGVAVEFGGMETGNGGSIYIDSISFSESGKLVRSGDDVFKFNDSEKWSMAGTKENSSFTIGNEGLLLDISTKKFDEHLLLLERMSNLRDNGHPDKFILKADKISGDPLVAMLVIRDSGGENFLLKAKDIEGKGGTYEWNISEIAGRWGGKGDKQVNYPVTVAEFRLALKNGGKAQVLLRSLKQESMESDLEALNVDVDTGHPLHILMPGKEKDLKLTIENKAFVPASFIMSVKFRNFYGETVTSEKAFMAGPGEISVWNFPFTPSKYGIWYIDYTLKDKDGKYRRNGQKSFAYMQPAGPTPLNSGAGKASLSKLLGSDKKDDDGFIFGMCTHTERWGKRDRELEVMATALCGAKIIRTGQEWGGIQPTPDVWKWEGLDEIVDMYMKQGVEMQVLLGFTPKWAADPEKQKSKEWTDWNRSKPDIEAWKKYAYNFASRYKGKIRFFELWNEPDIGFFKGTFEEYMEMIKTAYPEIKKANPDAIVLTGGFASLGYHPSTKKDFHKNVLEFGQDYFDVHATHEHGSFDNYVKITDGVLQDVRKLLKTNKPWYPNETAMHSLNGEDYQAEVLVQKMVFSKARGAIAYNWYDLRNDGFNPMDGEHNYGILTNDFYPKAGYPVYNELAKIMRGKKLVKDLTDSNVYAFLFAGGGEQVVAAWLKNSGTADSVIMFRNCGKDSSNVDMMGNRTTAPAADGVALMQVSAKPSYFTSSSSDAKSANIEPAGSFINVDSSVGCPGYGIMLNGKISNPFKDEREFKVSILLPEGISAADSSVTVKVPGLASKDFAFAGKIPADFRSEGQNKATLFYEMKASSLRGQLSIPMALAQRIEQGSMDTKKADFSLKTHASVYNFSEKDPTIAHLAWKGASDQSAEIKLAKGTQSVLIRVDLTDDIHFQEDSGLNVWRGDNIQMAIKIPGQSGFWELGFSMLKDGKAEVSCWTTPSGFKNPDQTIKLKTTPSQGRLVYDIEIPYSAIGVSDEILAKGIQFNLIVNDNDGQGRKGWIQIAPGIGQSKNPELFPYIVFPSGN